MYILISLHSLVIEYNICTFVWLCYVMYFYISLRATPHAIKVMHPTVICIVAEALPVDRTLWTFLVNLLKCKHFTLVVEKPFYRCYFAPHRL